MTVEIRKEPVSRSPWAERSKYSIHVDGELRGWLTYPRGWGGVWRVHSLESSSVYRVTPVEPSEQAPLSDSKTVFSAFAGDGGKEHAISQIKMLANEGRLPTWVQVQARCADKLAAEKAHREAQAASVAKARADNLERNRIETEERAKHGLVLRELLRIANDPEARDALAWALGKLNLKVGD